METRNGVGSLHILILSGEFDLIKLILTLSIFMCIFSFKKNVPSTKVA